MLGRKTILSGLLPALAVLLSGCGYKLVQYADESGEQLKIAIVTLANDSHEPGVELLATEALRREILSRGGLELISNPDRADYRLRGRVLPVKTRSRSFTGVVLAREYEITLGVEVIIDAARKGRRSLGRERFEATEIYFASADVAVLRKNRQEALRYLSGLLAGRMHDSIDRELLSATN